MARSPRVRRVCSTTTRARCRRLCAAPPARRRSSGSARRCAGPRSRTPRTPRRCSLFPASPVRLQNDVNHVYLLL